MEDEMTLLRRSGKRTNLHSVNFLKSSHAILRVFGATGMPGWISEEAPQIASHRGYHDRWGELVNDEHT